MPRKLFEEVKDEIPRYIGVYVGRYCVKYPKKQELGINEQVLKDSLIRSLYREFAKQYQSGSPPIVEALNHRLRRMETERNQYRTRYWDLMQIGIEKYGVRWHKEK